LAVYSAPVLPRIDKFCPVRHFHLWNGIVSSFDKICNLHYHRRNLSWEYCVEDLAMNVIAKIVVLLILLEVLFVIYGELRRNFLLRRIIQDKNLLQALVNCSACRRLAKTALLLVSGIFLCLSLCELKFSVQMEQNIGRILALLNAYDSGTLDANILLWEISFCLLVVEQLIPTRKR
jgi:hypothetical protein